MRRHGLELSIRPRPWAVRLGFLGLALLAAALPAGAADQIEYNRDIRPILSENCFVCHGPDSASRKGNLRLDKREAAIEAGAIVPNDPESSELIARVHSEDRDEVMPPRKSKKALTTTQKDLLKRWIVEGAEYQAHWSLIAPKRPELPAVKNAGWVRTPIDRFILAELERRGLSPAPEADRRTLARRVSLDLTGLPPEPADVEAFVNDSAPDAYEKLVDKLMASPRWGEHRGRYWLDAARYADTHGIHFDNYREMWTYRDWVINAFNKNMPFDQFTVEQIAGDLLPDRTLDQQIATGFNRNNITTNEGGAIDEEYRVLYTRDRTETVSQVYMGLTAGCAVCHDHKFDPLSQKEFYGLSAFFNNTTQAAMDGNIKDTPPAVFVPIEADRAGWQSLTADRNSLQKDLDARKPAARAEFDKFFAATTSEAFAGKATRDGLRLQASLDDRDAAKAPKRAPGSTFESADTGDFEKDQPFSYGAWINLGKAGLAGSIVARMDDKHDFRGWDLWVQDGRVSGHIVNKWPGNALKVTSNDQVKPKSWAHVLVTYDGSAKAAGMKVYIDGRPQGTKVEMDALKDTIRTKVPLKLGQRDSTSRVFDETLIHDARIYNRALSAEEAAGLAANSLAAHLASKPADKRPAAEVDSVFGWWLDTNDPPSKALREKIAKVDTELAGIKARGTVAHVMQERTEPAMASLLFRGDYDKPRDKIQADTPKVLPPIPSDQPKNRLGFARWLLLPEHPLTARVTVNRFWQEIFGTGIVRTAGDFGVTGELPSHPELLDWLAVDFRESGWDIKAFYKRIVMSAAYRQSAAVTPEKLEKDEQNRYLSRGPRFRMDAEMVRDYALSASGLLVGKIGGPSVKPYQPEGVWEAVAMIGSNTRDYKADAGDKLYRRSLYTFWKRSAPPASMDIFNAPSREVCTVRRERTNTPLQALVTLNDPQYIEAARFLAQGALKQELGSADARIDLLARRLLARPLRPEERKVVEASLDSLIAYYRDHKEDAKKLMAVGETKADPSIEAGDLAAWTMLTNELMNLDEVLNK